MGERQTEDLDVAGSSPAHGIPFLLITIFDYFIFYNITYLNRKINILLNDIFFEELI